MESSFAFIPQTTAEIFGSAALFLHLIAYGIYAREVYGERIRPNVITWLMWLAGGVVELITYDAITGSHWSTSALPFACVIGIGAITVAMLAAQIRNTVRGTRFSVHKTKQMDYWLVAFDMVAAVYWLWGGDAVLANVLAVSTSVITFIPIWRTTYEEPHNENYIPWSIWSFAYVLMFMAVLTGDGAHEWGLYFFPIYYFLLHAIVVWLSLRKIPQTPVTA